MISPIAPDLIDDIFYSSKRGMEMRSNSSNGAPNFCWETPYRVGFMRRRRLLAEGTFVGAYRSTEYFIDTAERAFVRVYGYKHALFASGKSEDGAAKLIGFGNRIDLLKHKAEQLALLYEDRSELSSHQLSPTEITGE
jgi:hypothetical protein